MASYSTRIVSLVTFAFLIARPAMSETWPTLTIPVQPTGGGEKDAALVMGIEDYFAVPHIPGARQNAKDWYLHLTRSLKVPVARARLLLDGEVTDDAMRSAAKAAAEKVQPGGTLWFVFIGHGAPAEDGRDGVLVGVDAQQSAEGIYKRSVRQRELLELLAKGSQAHTVAIVDACFSGKSSSGAVLVPGLQPLIALRSASADVAKTVLLTAGAADQFAGPLPDADRPAFSYLLLGALRGWGDQNGDGQVTADEAVTYAREAIEAVVRGRRQIPELAAGDGRAVLAKGAREKGPDLVAFVVAGEGRRQGAVAAPDVKTGGPVIKGSAVSNAVGEFAVDVKPRDGVRLELITPSGKKFTSGAPYRNQEAEPGGWKVVGSATGYEDEIREVLVPPDEVTVVKLALKQLGGLSIAGKPAGAAVKVNGPEGFADESGVPWEALGLRSGTYHVEVTRTGYEAFVRDVTVEVGQTARVAVELVREGEAQRGGTGGCPVGMAFVAGGTFTMGDRGDQVTVAPFCMDVTEVTVVAFAQCSAAKKCPSVPVTVNWRGISDEDRVRLRDMCNGSHDDRQRHPVNCVDWYEAAKFCATMGKRLPSEEEWEWAGRGGANGWKYPWGDTAPDSKTQNACGPECTAIVKSSIGAVWSPMYMSGDNWPTTAPVGSFRAGDSPAAISDLSGNVAEWTSSFDSAPERTGLMPLVAGYVWRGGGWGSSRPSHVRAAERSLAPTSTRSPGLGFRCVRSP